VVWLVSDYFFNTNFHELIKNFQPAVGLILNQILNQNFKYHFERSDHLIIGRRYAPQNYIYN